MRKYFIEISQHTDIGDRKKTNQDSIYSKYVEKNGDRIGLFIVADGVGGLAHGEDISNLVVKFFDRWFEDIQNKGFVNSEVERILDEAINVVNLGALEYSRSIGEKVGTTIALLFIYNDNYYVKSAGDSRVYLFQSGKKIRLTEDHSLVARMIKNNEISEEEALVHPKKNVITMCIGVNENLDIFSNKGELGREDVFLLCSDGFYNYSNESEILPIVYDRKLSFVDKAINLRRTITSGNARDNVSIILVKITSNSMLGF